MCSPKRLPESLSAKLSQGAGGFVLDPADRHKHEQPEWIERRGGRGEVTRLEGQSTVLTAALPLGAMRQAIRRAGVLELRVKHR